MHSMSVLKLDVTHLIRSPLSIMNLNLLSSSPERGLLNGLRPQDLFELARRPVDIVLGRETFLAPVEANECIFNEINQSSNWTSHLIRIDRPNTVQTVYTKIAFVQPPSLNPT